MATLKSLVDETSSIKDELKTCHVNLKNNLIEKGVECSEDNKMSSLIDKVSGIKMKRFISGTVIIENEPVAMRCVNSSTSYHTNACIKINFPFAVDYLYVYQNDDGTGINLKYDKFTDTVTTENTSPSAYNTTYNYIYKANYDTTFINENGCRLGVHDGVNTSTNGGHTGKKLKWIAIG